MEKLEEDYRRCVQEGASSRAQFDQEESKLKLSIENLRSQVSSLEADSLAKGAAVLEAEQNVSELSKTCRSLEAKVKEFNASIPSKEAYSTLDQAGDLQGVVAWLAQSVEESNAGSSDPLNAERIALQLKLTEVNFSNDSNLRELQAELKRLSRSQATLQREIEENKAVITEYEDLCRVLQQEKIELYDNLEKQVRENDELRKLLQDAGDHSSEKDSPSSPAKPKVASPARALKPQAGRDAVYKEPISRSLRFDQIIVYVEIGSHQGRVGVFDPNVRSFIKWYVLVAFIKNH
jgi:chromosome segregation ATPase